MNLPDFINGSFELCAGGAVAGHVRAILRDRRVEGFSPAAVAFFTTWGVWNLYYYPHLVQWWSFAGGLAVVSANLLYLGLIVKYKFFNTQRG